VIQQKDGRRLKIAGEITAINLKPGVFDFASPALTALNLNISHWGFFLVNRCTLKTRQDKTKQDKTRQEHYIFLPPNKSSIFFYFFL